MKNRLPFFCWLLVLVVLSLPMLQLVWVGAADNATAGPAWTNPSVKALKRVSPVASAQNQPNFLSNLDCSLMTYRLVADSTMQTGCFTETAFGLLDSDSDTVIFNGTDEGLPLLSYSPHQVLAPWPAALDLIALDAINTGGSFIHLYKNPLDVLQDQRNVLAQLTAKQLAAPPELLLRDSLGQPLVINPQTMAFSDGGSWLVVETLNGSFTRINLATLDTVAFAPAFGSQGNPSLLKSQVAVSDDGHYIAIYNQAASVFKVYDLASCSLPTQSCPSYDYWPFVQAQISGLQFIRHIRFINHGLLSFEAATSNPTGSGIYELAPTDSITSLIDYLGLGDSYTSGEGAFDYVADTDSDNNTCHLSRNSYPLLLTHDLFSSLGGRSVACSGATINDVGSNNENYQGQVRGASSLRQLQQSQAALLTSVMTNFAPGYVPQQRFVRQYQPAVLTVSVGGNDVGFNDILQNCVVPHVSRHLSDSTCFNTYEDRLELLKLTDRTVLRWTALYKQLLAEAPGIRLYAVGYPEIVADTGTCALNVQLNKSELEFAEELIDYLNGAIEKAARSAGVNYVDISQALAGHRLCETASYNVAVNGLTAGRDSGLLGLKLFGRESYHPNAFGQALIEQATLKQTHNLSALAAASITPANSGQKLLNKPKSNRPVHARLPVDNLTGKVVKRGVSTHIGADGIATGLKAKTTYSVRLDGSVSPPLTTVTTDEAGNISGEMIIPISTEPGGHTVDVTGPNQAGDPVDITQPIYVITDDQDADGDGISDATDSCPTAVNIGQDADRDGIDDICDGVISLPPAIGPTSNPPPSGNGASTDTYLTPTTTVRQFRLANALPAGGSNAPVGHTAVANVLGIATTDPRQVRPGVFRPTVVPRAHAKTRLQDRHNPAVIHWLPWTVLPIITWLFLLVLSFGLNQITRRVTRPEHIWESRNKAAN